MPVMTSRFGSPETLSWGLFVALVAIAIAVAAGFSSAPILALIVVFAVAWSFRYIYVAFYTGIFLTPLLGIMVSAPTGNLLFGQRAFGGTIDVSLAEVVFFCVIAAWALKMLFLWWRRSDQNWKPRWPLIAAYVPLVAAHLASVASPLQPDPYLVAKFTLRPVIFDYLAFIALPANLIKSRRRLVAALGAFSAVGLFAALNGLRSIFFPDSGEFLGRAHPLGIFGVPALGENHNELAELLVATAPITLALSYLVKTPRAKRLLAGSAAFQFAIGILTFTRSVWIVFALQGVFLVWIMWRDTAKRHLSSLLLGAVVLLPFAIGMVVYSLSSTALSSNSTRLMLAQIATQVFESSPVFGGGAGTFYQRVGSTQVFLIEYGDPLDSHGFIQKIAAETGLFGLIALGVLVLSAVRFVRRGLQGIAHGVDRGAVLLLVAAGGGAFVYQLFNTAYWTGKLWLPLGLLIAALHVLRAPAHGSDSSGHAILEG